MPASRQTKSASAAGPPLPRRLRWLQPLLALAGLGSLPPAVPAHGLEAAPAIARVQQLRERLLASDATLAGPAAKAGLSDDEQVAQWKKWDDWNNWNNWAKWGKV